MSRKRYFQWLHGDLAGSVEVLKNITQEEDEYFYNFESDESCNLRFIGKITGNVGDLKGKAMVEIISPNDPWIAETITTKRVQVMDENAGETYVDAPPLEDITGASGSGANLDIAESKLGQKKYRAPRYKGPYFDLPSIDEYMKSDDPVQIAAPVQAAPVQAAPVQQVIQPVIPVETPKISAVSETDPVRILAKTCKKHSTEINLTININLPSKAIYNIAESEFENGGKNFVDCLVEDIDIKEIVRSISDALKTAYASVEE